MKTLCDLTLAMFAALPASAQPVRVGTLDKASIVVAYTRSQLKAALLVSAVDGRAGLGFRIDRLGD